MKLSVLMALGISVNCHKMKEKYAQGFEIETNSLDESSLVDLEVDLERKMKHHSRHHHRRHHRR